MTEQNLFKTGAKIIERFEENNYEGYFVGGAVRDFTLGRDVSDVDITTNALPDEIENLFEKTIDVGKEHGTIIVLMDDIPFEVTTYRVEGEYTDHRRPDNVYFTQHLTEDLSRRDFTINAMAMTSAMELYDPHNGIKDLNNKLINTVGIAKERFDEDALRMLRAVRFMSQLDFELSLDAQKAIKEHAAALDYVAVERITAELEKLYRGINVKSAKEMIAQTGLLKYMPFFKHIDRDRYVNSAAESLGQEAAVHIYKDSGLKEHLSKLKLSNRQKAEIKASLQVIGALTEQTNEKLIAYRFETDILNSVNDIIRLNELLDTEHIELLEKAVSAQPDLILKNRSDLDINGNSLMSGLNARGGPWLRECLDMIEQEVLLGNLINNEAEIINWVKSHVKNEDGNIVFTDGR
ncbi:CCA-adding enzyme [Jeotgalicoccus coquinae]|uniref:CCA-adding enzyme n=1 Tax=Jeotgalicoccus coquinae TaxID=709509 RepID=A0A6V7R9I8_9STAP|nr:CCA tRNA nucleotidyltransferase [Jeotgalicoccus coquinae]MBB6422957.1 tRNA nucleotidyltransferase (CCA-adding enzyme) [Jeotgalicoccus coquinae]GGE11821.1 CCA-adding enzyme [Jeotgalicoccus coquinae]CAD2073575.1 CCA-adding enzyme [Jeotgalicoccus coquinae]